MKNMAIEELFNCISSRSCGLCCSKSVLCDDCEKATLRQNGLSEGLQHEIHGLMPRSYSHGNGFKYSELYNKLSELIKTQMKGIK